MFRSDMLRAHETRFTPKVFPSSLSSTSPQETRSILGPRENTVYCDLLNTRDSLWAPITGAVINFKKTSSEGVQRKVKGWTEGESDWSGHIWIHGAMRQEVSRTQYTDHNSGQLQLRARDASRRRSVGSMDAHRFFNNLIVYLVGGSPCQSWRSNDGMSLSSSLPYDTKQYLATKCVRKPQNPRAFSAIKSVSRRLTLETTASLRSWPR